MPELAADHETLAVAAIAERTGERAEQGRREIANEQQCDRHAVAFGRSDVEEQGDRSNESPTKETVRDTHRVRNAPFSRSRPMAPDDRGLTMRSSQVRRVHCSRGLAPCTIGDCRLSRVAVSRCSMVSVDDSPVPDLALWRA